jgi:hypothetical protein
MKRVDDVNAVQDVRCDWELDCSGCKVERHNRSSFSSEVVNQAFPSPLNISEMWHEDARGL